MVVEVSTLVVVKVVVLTFIEEGKKKAMIEMNTMDPELALCVPLPDSLHVGKSLKPTMRDKSVDTLL